MRTYLSLVLVMAVWGSAFASSTVAVGAVPPEVAAMLRFAIGAMLLLALRPAWGRTAPRLSGRDLRAAAGLGMVGVFGYNGLFFVALSLARVCLRGSVIVPVTAPVITVAVTAMIGRRRLPAVKVVGLTTAVAGAVVFFVGIPTATGDEGRLLGDLVFVLAAGCWSAYTICGAPVLRRLPALSVTTNSMAAGALALALFAAPSVGEVNWSDLDSGFWLNQAYLAAIPTALAYIMYYQAVHRVGPATAASAMFLVPVFGVSSSWVFLGESITAVQAAGAVLMLAGAWLATRPERALTPHRDAPIVVVHSRRRHQKRSGRSWPRSPRTNRKSAAVTASAPSEPCRSSAPSPPSSR